MVVLEDAHDALRALQLVPDPSPAGVGALLDGLGDVLESGLPDDGIPVYEDERA